VSIEEARLNIQRLQEQLKVTSTRELIAQSKNEEAAEKIKAMEANLLKTKNALATNEEM
jgi:hypothetical protein